MRLGRWRWQSGTSLALGAVPVAAAVVGDLRLLAGCAAQDVSEQRRAAALFDGRHHLQLPERQVAPLLASEDWAGSGEDVRDLSACYLAVHRPRRRFPFR